MALRIQELDYSVDAADRFEVIADEPWAIFLDSGGLGRYDILAARPVATLITQGAMSEIDRGGGVTRSEADPFALLRGLLAEYPVQGPSGWPFAGGAMGYFGYDLARRIERLPDCNKTSDPFPDLAFGIYAWALVVDHSLQRAALLAVAELVDDRAWRGLVELFTAPVSPRERPPLRAAGPLTVAPDRPGYGEAFAAIQRYIHDGDCYQINFARRFEAPATGDPWAGYRRLRQLSPAPYGGFFRSPGGCLLSASPERFLTLREGRVSTSPIKGTRPRHADPARDAALAVELSQSPKDRAENLMIVDLLRNDLGRCCQPGSIRVERLFGVESFATVHHLVSDIEGLLRAGEDALSLMRHCFPGGSVTGAPKPRAMAIIEELEATRRGPYCGSLAIIGFDGAMDSNILIRTLMHSEVVKKSPSPLSRGEGYEKSEPYTLTLPSALASCVALPPPSLEASALASCVALPLPSLEASPSRGREIIHNLSGERLWYWAGGGIVADSTEQAEFEETEQKALAMLRTVVEG